MTGYRDPWADDAPCQRCGKNVHLPHNPPMPCGQIRCDTCPPCECPVCSATWNEVCS